jgi:hypothetical protein
MLICSQLDWTNPMSGKMQHFFASRNCQILMKFSLQLD